MKVTIRKFRKKDVYKASNAVKRAERITLKKYYPQGIINEFCKKNNPKNFLIRAKERQFFVAEDKVSDRILGVIAIKDNQLKTFCVDPTYQKRGVGRKLYERFKKEALKRKLKKVVVYSSLYAIPVYERFGFKKIKKRRRSIKGIGYDDMVMGVRY